MTEQILPRTTPRAAGLDSRAVETLLDEVEAHRVELHSLMVIRNGAVAVEGWWAPYTADRRQLLYSLSKSFTSIAAALAVSEGLLELDAPAFALFPDLVTDPRPAHLDRLTLRHALTMATGHETDPVEAVLAAPAGTDPLAAFAALAPEREPGTIFTYNQLATHLVARSVERVTGRALPEYLGERLWQPTGVGGAGWQQWAGHTMGYSGLHLTTEAVAAFGQLLLQRGSWNGHPLVPAERIDEAVALQIPNDLAHRAPGAEANPEWQQGYGFQFWRNRTGYRGDGAYGQYLVVWPDLDTVVVTTAEVDQMHILLDLLTTHLRPALQHSTGSTADDDRLAARLLAAALPRPADDGASLFNADVPITQGLAWATRVVVHPDDSGWTVDLHRRDGAVVTLAAGADDWAPGSWPGGPGLQDVPVMVAAGVVDGTFTAHIRLIETPHSLRLQVAADGAGIRWRHDPLHGTDPAALGLPLPPSVTEP